jgi:hypothetical protein
MSSERWVARLRDILDAILEIEGFTSRMDLHRVFHRPAHDAGSSPPTYFTLPTRRHSGQRMARTRSGAPHAPASSSQITSSGFWPRSAA